MKKIVEGEYFNWEFILKSIRVNISSLSNIDIGSNSHS